MTDIPVRSDITPEAHPAALARYFDQVVSMIGVNEDIIPSLRQRLLTAAALPLEDRRAAIKPLLITTYTERTKAPRTRPVFSAAARRQKRRLRRSRLAAAA